MKKILLVLLPAFHQCGLCAVLRWRIPFSEPQIYEVPSHPAHAAYTPMSQEQSVLAATSYSAAQGERRASDFPQPDGVSLGAYAREIRKQHAQLKKARVVWINQ